MICLRPVPRAPVPLKKTFAAPKTFAYFVGIIPPAAECRFEDNFINIDPGKTATIVFTSPKKYDLNRLQIRGYNC